MLFLAGELFLDFFFLGETFSAIAATTTKIEPIQSIFVITKPNTKTEPIVAEKGSNASSKLAVEGLMKRREFVIN